jgi:GGDEF domain-containing protein
MTFLMNLERLGPLVGLNIALSPAVVIGMFIAAILPLTPIVAQRSFLPLCAAMSVLYLVLSVLTGIATESVIGGYLVIFGYFGMLFTLGLSYQVSLAHWEFRQAVSDITFANAGAPIGDVDELRRVIDVEMIRSRRTERPLSLMIFETEASAVDLNTHKLVQSVQRSMLQRYLMATVARVLARTLRRTDVVFEHDVPGRLVVVAPETNKREAERMGERISELVQDRLGIAGKYSTAAFPSQALTYEDLLNVAEQGLDKANKPDTSAEAGVALEIGARLPVEVRSPADKEHVRI